MIFLEIWCILSQKMEVAALKLKILLEAMAMKKFLLTVVLLILLTGSAFAQEVTADGYGLTREEAIHRAEQTAVEQVVGTYIDANTLVENAVVQLDELYAASQGFVSNVQILREGRMSDGSYFVQARMNVDAEANTALMSRLETIMRLNDPRITVIMLKDDAPAGTHDELSEAAINDRLLELGFNHIVDADIVANLENAVLLERIYNGERGLVGVGDSYGADYLVLGKTHASAGNIQLPDYKTGSYKRHPLNLGNADITAKIIKLQNGEIVGTFTVSGRGNGTDSDLAERNAIKTAAQNAAVEIENKFKKVAMKVTNRRNYRYDGRN